MGKVIYSLPITEVHGAFGNDKFINRQKKFRDENGRILREGHQETYVIKHPRNLKKNPRKGAERINNICWSEACQRASQILLPIRIAKLPPEERDFHLQIILGVRQSLQLTEYYSFEKAQEMLETYKNRFRAQLPSTRGTHPDPLAPIDPKTRKGKRYVQFHAFLRAILFYEIKQKYNATE